MRRISTLAMTLAATSAFLVGPVTHALAVPPPPKPFLTMVQDDGVGNCIVLIYADPPAPLNQLVTWDDVFPGDVTVNEVAGFWSIPMSDGDEVYRNVTEAGTFNQECGGAVTSLPVAVSAPAATSDPTVRVRWATPFSSPDTDVYSVQYKVGLNSVVRPWKSKSVQKTAIFPGEHGHAYFFRALTFIDDLHHSSWSPWK